MAKKPDETPATRSIPLHAEPETFIVGLRKLGPKKYSVVTGTLSSPIVDLATDPLEYAAEAMKLSIHKMLQVIP